jgi:hypothetical protein
MSELSDLIISSVLVADMTPQSMLLPVTIGTKKQTIKTQALLDCRASGEFMDSEFTRLHNIPLIKLNKPWITRNTDGTQNEQGVVTHKAIINLGVNRKEDLTTFFITGLGKGNIILGLTWLRRHNLIINWKEGTLKDQPCLSKVLRQKILASQKKVETLNNTLMKGTPFETKPLRMIKIGNVEVSEETLTLTIEDKPEVTMWWLYTEPHVYLHCMYTRATLLGLYRECTESLCRVYVHCRGTFQ